MATAKPAAKSAAKPAAKPAAKTTAVAVKKTSGGLVSLKEKMAQELAALAGRTAPGGGDKIQIKDKMFHLPDGGTAETLDLVIVDFINVNNFYEGAYNPKAIVPPTCFAIGQVISTMAPSDNSPVKQSDECASCPMNQFGSSNAGKACKNQRRLAVLPPDADDDTPLWILDVSPTGLKSFDSYVRSAAAKFGTLPIGLVTTVTFDEAQTYASLRFGNPQPNEHMEVHWERRGEAADRLKQEPDVSSYQAAPPPRGRAAPAARARK